MQPTPPSSLTDRFEIRAQLGRGAMGIVYRVFDREMDTEVALKSLISNDPDQLYWLKQEFRTLAGILHLNLVELYEMFVDELDCFFTMELIDGRSFTEYVERGFGGNETIGAKESTDAAATERLIDATQQLVEGLAALHDAGRLHHDIKPSNVLVDRRGRVVILDFGLATAFGRDDGRETQSDGFAGTFAYMPPEQAWGRATTPASDWYSVGVILYESLTHRLPYDGPPARVLAEKERGSAQSPAALNSHVPADLDALVMDLLRPDPAARPGSQDILSRLRGVTGYVPAAARSFPRALEGPFVGRQSELLALEGFRGRVATGRPVIVHIVGPSGIGKSEMVRRFAAHTQMQNGMLVLSGRCNPQEQVPYKALDGVIDRLSRHLGSLPDSILAALIPRYAGALMRLFPVLARVPTFSERQNRDDLGEPQEIRRRGAVALRDLLGRMVVQRPLLLWIDDAQWSDPDSAMLLRDVFRQPDAPEVLLVLSYRSEDCSGVPLIEMLSHGAEDTAEWTIGRVDLPHLDDVAARALAAELCPGHPSEYANAIAQEARGSPFLLRQLAAHRGDPTRRSTPDLATVMRERLAVLSDPARQLLEIVAVAGQPIDRSVALRAAGSAERGRPMVLHLEQRGLLRSAPVSGRMAVEIYHDRIREALLADIDGVRLRDDHRRIADVLRAQASPDPEALFRHSLGSGELDEAASWAVAAGDRAAQTLAFVEAAELYRRALELRTWESSRTAELEAKRADALVNAGRCAEAAPIFHTAAQRTSGVAALDLRRRAAEQYLVSGHLDEGIVELRALLTALDLRYPRSPSATAVAALGRIAQIAVRGTGFEILAEAAIAPETLARIDACDAAAKGLIVVDPLRGLYFALVSLLLALRSGEARRVGRALSMSAGALIPVGRPIAQLGMRLLRTARQLADARQETYLAAIVKISTAQVRLLEGEWREMLALCDTGVSLLKDHCRGVRWECDIALMGALRALEELGEVADLRTRAESYLRESEERGDLYGEVTARLYRAFWRLADDAPADARQQTRDALQRWTAHGFNLQHFYAARVEAYADLYEGNPRDAWQRIEKMWPLLAGANLTRVNPMRCDAHLLRARAALAVASRGVDRRRMLKTAADSVRVLAADMHPYAQGHAAAVGGIAAEVEHNRGAADEMLRRAEQHYRRAGMQLAQTCTAAYRASLTNPTAAAADMDAVAKLGVRAPEKWVAMWSPRQAVGLTD